MSEVSNLFSVTKVARVDLACKVKHWDLDLASQSVLPYFWFLSNNMRQSD